MENQVISHVQTSETSAAMTSAKPFSPEATAKSVATADVMSQMAITAVVPMPTSTHVMRHQLFSKFVTARCGIESQVSASVNAQCGPRYKGTFEIRFDNPNEVTTKTLSTFCGNGAVFFTPDDINKYPALKKARKIEDGINLSALMTRAKRPANIDDTAWHELAEMWKAVSTVLYTHGLAPMHMLISRALAEKGLGGPKISKKLSCGNANAGDKSEIMSQVLDRLNELLNPNTTVK